MRTPIAQRQGNAWLSAARRLGHAKVYGAAVIASLALGIGANAGVFAVVRTALLRGLPYPHDQDLVSLQSRARSDASLVSVDAIERWAQSPLMESVAALVPAGATVQTTGPAQFVEGAWASANLLDALRTVPAVGRWLELGDESPDAEPVIVLSHDLSDRLYGSDSTAVGRFVTVDGFDRRVVGVLARNVEMPGHPLFFEPGVWRSPVAYAVARRSVFVPMPALQHDLGSQLAESRAAHDSLEVVSLHALLFGDSHPALLLISAVALLIFLVACANVANLALTRTFERRREFAIRVAVGAPTDALKHDMYCETGLLLAASALLGIGLAVAGARLLAAVSPESIRQAGVHIGFAEVTVAFVLASAAGFAATQFPMGEIARTDPAVLLATGSSRTKRSRRVKRIRFLLAVAEISLALVLTAGTGLLLKTLARLERVDLGFDPSHLVLFGLRLSPADYPDAPDRRAFVRRVEAALRREPGVQSVAYGPSPLIGSTGYFVAPIRSGHVDSRLEIRVLRVDANYFGTYGVRLLAGRAITYADSERAPAVAVLNDVAARLLFPLGGAVGQSLPTLHVARDQVSVVVGVAHATVQQALSAPIGPEVYISAAQGPLVSFDATFGIRTALPKALVARVPEILRTMDGRLASDSVGTMESFIRGSLTQQRFLLDLLLVFAVLAVLIACLGLYGVLNDMVSQEAGEIALRMALGQTTAGVVRLVLRRALLAIAFASVIALPVGLMLTHLTVAFLYSVPARDPATFFESVVVVSIFAVVASLVPTVRATRIQPMQVLRGD